MKLGKSGRGRGEGGGGRVVEVKRRKKKSINSGVILNARLGKNILAVPFE